MVRPQRKQQFRRRAGLRKAIKQLCRQRCFGSHKICRHFADVIILWVVLGVFMGDNVRACEHNKRGGSILRVGIGHVFDAFERALILVEVKQKARIIINIVEFVRIVREAKRFAEMIPECRSIGYGCTELATREGATMQFLFFYCVCAGNERCQECKHKYRNCCKAHGLWLPADKADALRQCMLIADHGGRKSQKRFKTVFHSGTSFG